MHNRTQLWVNKALFYWWFSGENLKNMFLCPIWTTGGRWGHGGTNNMMLHLKYKLLATHYHLCVWERSWNRCLDTEFGISIHSTSWLLNRIVEPACNHASRRFINNPNISTKLRHIILACEMWSSFFSFYSSNTFLSQYLMYDQGHYLRIFSTRLSGSVFLQSWEEGYSSKSDKLSRIDSKR